MITSEELIRLARVNRLKPYQQEKHYLQTATLTGVYSNLTDELVFKGGTALFFFYGLDRFSEDLDFTKIKQYNQDKLKTTVSDMLTIIHIDHEIKTEKSLEGKTLKVKARGPLYKGPLSESVIAIEISERNDIILQPDIKEIVPIYDDLRPFTVPVMKKEEILAEKIRALMIRRKARDLYDVAFLLKKDISLQYNLINKKLAYYKKTFEVEEFIHQATSIKNIWQSELHGLVPKTPLFDDILHFILGQLK
jgi:predicted nucleotidyltransferase component of viral defense system